MLFLLFLAGLLGQVLVLARQLDHLLGLVLGLLADQSCDRHGCTGQFAFRVLILILCFVALPHVLVYLLQALFAVDLALGAD